jgi:type I restriction enzyme S subunit
MSENVKNRVFKGKSMILSELCDSITDCPHSTPEWTSYGKIVVRNFNIKKGRLLLNNPSYTNEATFNERVKRSQPLPGDLIITREAPMGEVCIIPKGFECCLGQRMVLIKPNIKIINNKYLLYALQSEFVQKQIQKSDRTGSIVSNLRIPLLEELNIPRFGNVQENSIGHILDSIDSKIELNNRINAELEAMAKTLYDYWFVQFDFPDKNGKPYKTSGGKMVWNEALKREIPEGWEGLTLGEVVASTGTGLNPRDNFILGEGDNYYVTIKNIEQGRVILDNKCDKISDKSLEIINKRSDLRIGDVLFTSIEPVGITYLILEKPKNWNINESVFTIRPNYEKVTSEFLYMFLSGDFIKSYTRNVSAGSIHKGVRHSLLKDCKFILPERNTVDEFTLKVQPILKKLDLIQKENQKLTELRDWLLPMLMNGQVKVMGEKETELSMAAEPAATYKKSRT